MQPRLALNSRSSCLSLLRAGITDVYRHAWLVSCILKALVHLMAMVEFIHILITLISIGSCRVTFHSYH
jgi:hypothetical protein